MSDLQISEAQNFQQELDAYTPNLMQALPANVSVEKFKRVLTTAVGMNPDLYYANRRTFFTAAVRCAADGLLPDGREAALVVYRTKTKQRDPRSGIDREVEIQAVTYMPMIAGIRKRMRNSGDVVSATAEVVYSNDRFRYRLGDDSMIEHEPPPLGEARGKPVGAYARIVLRSGEVLRDVLTLEEIEAARKQGRATNSLMWTKFWSEGAKKTALRRCAKAAPQSAEIEALLSREEEPPLVSGPDHLPLPPPAPEPPPQHGEFYEPPPEDEAAYEVIDCDGTIHSFVHGGRAIEALLGVIREAARLGRLEAAWIDNQATLEELTRNGIEIDQVVDAYYELRNQASSRAAAERPRPSPQPQPTEGVPMQQQAEMPLAGDERRVPRAAPPIQAAAPPATSPAPMADSGAPTAGAGANSPVGPGPTAQTSASLSDQPRTVRMVTDARGQPNYRTWMLAALIPAMRRIVVGDELAWFCADNDEAIEAACRDPALRREYETARAEQWNAIKRIEAGGI